jgi:2-keto-4-pentenoate hydratase
MSTMKIRGGAAILAAARETGTPIDNLPEELRPNSLAEAYAMQMDIVGRLGNIAGWKVGPLKEHEEPRAAPIADRYVLASCARWPATGPTRIEVELALKIGAALPRRASPYRRAEVLEAIESAHVAYEILGARFIDRRKIDPLTYLADGQGNGGLVTGGVIPDWTSRDLGTLPMVLKVDGAVAESVAAGPSLERTIDAAVLLANHAAQWSDGLAAGQIILTGARIGPISIPAGRRAEAVANGVATVSLILG